MNEQEEGQEEMVDNEKSDDFPCKSKGMEWRVSLSILGGVGWLVFLLLWLFFYASEYNGYQNIAIILISILIICAVLGVPWAMWGLKNRKKMEKEMIQSKGFKWRMWLSGIVALGLLIVLIVWFYVYAIDYSIYQNIAIFIVLLLIMGGIEGAMWAPWGMRQEKKHKEEKEE
jgi:hypothetical protein